MANEDDKKECTRLNTEMTIKLTAASVRATELLDRIWATNIVKNGFPKTPKNETQPKSENQPKSEMQPKSETQPNDGPWYYEPSLCNSAQDRARKAFIVQSNAIQGIYNSAIKSISQLGESNSKQGAKNMPEDFGISILDSNPEEEIIPDDKDDPIIDCEKPTNANIPAKDTLNKIKKAATIFTEDMRNGHPLTTMWQNSVSPCMD